MRYMRRLAGSALAGTAALLAVSGGAFGAANAASAAKPPALPSIGDLKQVIADGVHNRVYLATTDGIVVTNMAGGLVKRVDTGESVSHMALSPDSNTLFAVIPGANEVAAVSTTKLADGLLYKLPAGDAPSGLAYQAGKIWVSYTTAAGGAIGSFKVGSAAFTASALTTTGIWPTAPRLAADPNPVTQGTLVAVDDEADPTMIAAYNVNGAKTPLAENDAFAACTGLSDVAVSAGGGRFVLACTGSATELGFSATTLAAVPAADFASGAGTDAVAIAPDNSGTATGNNDAAAAKLATFKANGAAENAYSLTADGYTVAPDGLSWTSDATKLVAVLKAGANYALDVVGYAQYKASSLDLTSTGTYYAGGKVTLRGKLKLGGAAAPAGTTVKIFRQVVGSSALTTLTTHTVAGGTFTLTNVPPRYAHYFYTAYYATNGTYAPNWHSCLIIVNPLHTTLRLTAPGSVAGGTTVQVTAHLGKTYNSRYVAIFAQPAGGAKKLVKKGKVNSAGNLTISYTITANTTFTAVFAGDSHYAPVTVKATVNG